MSAVGLSVCRRLICLPLTYLSAVDVSVCRWLIETTHEETYSPPT